MNLVIDETTDLDKFWLVHDSLGITDNVFFGIGSSYFCGHGCHICYIRDELKEMYGKTQAIYGNDIAAMTKTWDEMFTFFSSVSLDEDPFYLKLNHPAEYQWFVENAHKHGYGTTDNGIFRIARLNEIKFKEMFEISISLSFAQQVGSDKIIEAMAGFNCPIHRVKFLIDIPDYYPTDLIEWCKARKIRLIIHPIDYHTGEPIDFVIKDYDFCENNWAMVKSGTELVKVHVMNDCLVYYDQFFFSNNIGDIPFYKMDTNGFDYRLYLSKRLEGKQQSYLRYLDHNINEHVRKYYENTQKYKVNHDYTFIPNFMVDYKVRYFNRMIELGWVATPHGLLAPNTDKIIPIIEKKK